MAFEKVKADVLNLDKSERNRFILKVLPEILPQIGTDKAFLNTIRQLINEESTRTYREQHMGGI